MKLLIASDIHGDINAAIALTDAFEKSGADRLVLLGDLLYHGPRNDLPSGYAPKKVIALLNSHKSHILAVRGNCDTEVDQMVLEFPILADYAMIESQGLRMYLTHGHKFNEDNPPPLCGGEVLLCGHTHVSGAVRFGDNNLYLNPGSPTLPKENTPKGYILYNYNGSHTFELTRLDGTVYDTVTI